MSSSYAPSQAFQDLATLILTMVAMEEFLVHEGDAEEAEVADNKSDSDAEETQPEPKGDETPGPEPSEDEKTKLVSVVRAVLANFKRDIVDKVENPAELENAYPIFNYDNILQAIKSADASSPDGAINKEDEDVEKDDSDDEENDGEDSKSNEPTFEERAQLLHSNVIPLMNHVKIVLGPDAEKFSNQAEIDAYMESLFEACPKVKESWNSTTEEHNDEGSGDNSAPELTQLRSFVRKVAEASDEGDALADIGSVGGEDADLFLAFALATLLSICPGMYLTIQNSKKEHDEMLTLFEILDAFGIESDLQDLRKWLESLTFPEESKEDDDDEEDEDKEEEEEEEEEEDEAEEEDSDEDDDE